MPTSDDDGTYTETDTASNTTTGSTETDSPNDPADDGGWVPSAKVAGFLTLIGAVIGGSEVESAAEYNLLNEEGDPQLIYYLFADPIEWARQIVVELIWLDILRPFGQAVFDAGVASVMAFITLLFGSDMSVGVSEGSTIGIVDIPIAIVSPVIGLITWYTDFIVTGIGLLNQDIAGAFAQFGIAAPIVTNTLWVGEIGVFVWAAWVSINAIDIPLIRLVDTAKAALAPFMRLMEWFR